MSHLVADAIAQHGEPATYAWLLTKVPRHLIRRALKDGAIVRVGHGLYAPRPLPDPVDVATRLHGVVSHTSAAVAHGWEVRSHPTRPDILVPRSRGVSQSRRRGVNLRWRDFTAADVVDRVTTPVRTIIDCARDLPLADALAVADSALRAGDVTECGLRKALEHLPRSGRERTELVLSQASALAANPFESALRAHSITAVGPLFTPQAEIHLERATYRPDLVCEKLRVILEADSHTFHTSRDALNRDCRRYNELTLAGWLVLRFTWEQVMTFRTWVIDVISRGVEGQRARLAV